MLFASGDTAGGLALAAAAADTEEVTDKHPVTPAELLPARELEADMLLAAGRYREALAAYRATLAREPRPSPKLLRRGAGRPARRGSRGGGKGVPGVSEGDGARGRESSRAGDRTSLPPNLKADDPVSPRSYLAPDGRTWTFRRRPEIRQEEAETHVTLLVESLGEVRVVSCLRVEWESAEPDLRRLLARAVPDGRIARRAREGSAGSAAARASSSGVAGRKSRSNARNSVFEKREEHEGHHQHEGHPAVQQEVPGRVRPGEEEHAEEDAGEDQLRRDDGEHVGADLVSLLSPVQWEAALRDSGCASAATPQRSDRHRSWGTAVAAPARTAVPPAAETAT